jgi:hypothetical protein
MNTKLIILILCTLLIIPQQASAANGGCCGRLFACFYRRQPEAPIAPAQGHEGDNAGAANAAAGVVDAVPAAPAGAGAPAGEGTGRDLKSILKQTLTTDTTDFALQELNAKDKALFASFPICIRPTHLNIHNVPVFCDIDSRTPYLLRKITCEERCMLTAVDPKDINDEGFNHAIIKYTCSEFSGKIINTESLNVANTQWFTCLNTFKALAKLLGYIRQYVEMYGSVFATIDTNLLDASLRLSLPSDRRTLGPFRISKESESGLLICTESTPFTPSEQSVFHALIPLLLTTLANLDFSEKEPRDIDEFKALGIIIAR